MWEDVWASSLTAALHTLTHLFIISVCGGNGHICHAVPTHKVDHRCLQRSNTQIHPVPLRSKKKTQLSYSWRSASTRAQWCNSSDLITVSHSRFPVAAVSLIPSFNSCQHMTSTGENRKFNYWSTLISKGSRRWSGNILPGCWCDRWKVLNSPTYRCFWRKGEES